MSADFAWGVLAAFVFLAAAIAVTAAVWDLPRDGIDLGDDPAEPSPLATWQDSREAYRNVRVLPQASDPVTLTHYLVGDNVIDLGDEPLADWERELLRDVNDATDDATDDAS